MNQVIATIQHPAVIVSWMNAAAALSPDWTTETAEMETHSHEGYKGRLVDGEGPRYLPSSRVLGALAKHLETIEWSRFRQESGTLVRYTKKDVTNPALDLKSWRSFLSSADHARRVWRTSRSKREGSQSRCCSWAKVSNNGVAMRRLEANAKPSSQ
jgi:hypothetical protein